MGLRVGLVQQIPLASNNAAFLGGCPVEDRPTFGPLGRFAQALLLQCARESADLSGGRWFADPRMAEHQMVLGGGSAPQLALPIARDWAISDTTFHRTAANLTFIPVVASPGTALLVQDTWAPPNMAAVPFERDILLLAICIIFPIAMVAGVVVWVMERGHRNSMFPPGFRDGVFNAIWWSVVTVSTVGYGDSFPVRSRSKCFGLAWIMLGVLLLSLYQASIVTSMNDASQQLYLDTLTSSADDVPGLRIAVVANTASEWRLRSRGARVVSQPTLEAAASAFQTGQYDALAVDALEQAVVARDLLGGLTVRPDGLIVETTTFGMLLAADIAAAPSLVPAYRTVGECLFGEAQTSSEFQFTTYFADYVAMGFASNAARVKQRRQSSAEDATITAAATICPIVAAASILAAYGFAKRYPLDAKERLGASEYSTVRVTRETLRSMSPPIIHTAADGDDDAPLIT